MNRRPTHHMPPRRPGRPCPGREAVFLARLGLLALFAVAGCDDGDGASPADGPAAPDQDAGTEAAADATAEAGAREAPAAYPRPQYQRLSETGLYADLATRSVAPDNLEFRPAHQLWSDNADKHRWLKLPE